MSSLEAFEMSQTLYNEFMSWTHWLPESLAPLNDSKLPACLFSPSFFFLLAFQVRDCACACDTCSGDTCSVLGHQNMPPIFTVVSNKSKYVGSTDTLACTSFLGMLVDCPEVDNVSVASPKKRLEQVIQPSSPFPEFWNRKRDKSSGCRQIHAAGVGKELGDKLKGDWLMSLLLFRKK